MAKSRLSTRRVTSVQTYDPTDCTTVGWDVTLYSDGHLAAENWSCWQGGITGERWVTAPGRVEVHKDSDDEIMQRDMRGALDVLDSAWDCWSYGWTIGDWRSVSRGRVIR
jgi:hypothetical protein